VPTTYHRNRFLLLCGMILALALFYYAGEWFAVPAMTGFEPSVLRQSSGAFAAIVVALATWVAVVLCTFVAGTVRADAGLCCAAFGMMAMSARGGPIRFALMGSSPGVFWTLTFELVFLFAVLGVGALVVRQMVKLRLVRDEEDFQRDDSPLDQRIIATATHACATATLMLILCRSDQKAQCLASAGIASLLASLIAGMVAPVRPGFWYWISPMFVGALGYIWAARSPENLAIGRPGGYFQALARPLPLDYASAGVAGAMLGYWVARAWQRQREHAESSDSSPTGAPAPAKAT
jgi:hypothetical protein